MELTGGQWFAPVIILVLVLAGLSAAVAKKSKNKKLKYWLDFLMYFMMIGVVIMFWFWYSQGQLDLINAALYTLIVIYTILEQLTLRYKDILSQKLGLKYLWLKRGIIGIYILFVVLLLLIGSHFSASGWIVSGIVLAILLLISVILNKVNEKGN